MKKHHKQDEEPEEEFGFNSRSATVAQDKVEKSEVEELKKESKGVLAATETIDPSITQYGYFYYLFQYAEDSGKNQQNLIYFFRWATSLLFGRITGLQERENKIEQDIRLELDKLSEPQKIKILPLLKSLRDYFDKHPAGADSCLDRELLNKFFSQELEGIDFSLFDSKSAEKLNYKLTELAENSISNFTGPLHSSFSVMAYGILKENLAAKFVSQKDKVEDKEFKENEIFSAVDPVDLIWAANASYIVENFRAKVRNYLKNQIFRKVFRAISLGNGDFLDDQFKKSTEDDGYADFVELLANQRDMIIRNIRHAINFQMDIYQVFNGVLAVIWQTVNSWLVDNEWKEVEFKLGDWDWSDDMQRFLCLYMVYEVFLAVNISLNHLILPTDRGDAISDFSESDRCCCFNLSARTSKRSIASAPQHQNLSSASVAALKKVGVIDRFAVKKNALAWYWKFLTASAMLLEIGAGLALSFLFPPAAPIIAPYLGKLIYWQLGLFAAGLTLLAHLSHIGLQDLPVAQIADLNPELVNAAPATQRHQESQAVERLDAANNPHRIFSGHDRHSRGGALSSLTIDAAAAFNEARDNTLSPTGSFHSVVLSPLVQQSIHSPRSPLSQVASEVPTSRPMSPTSDGP